MLRFVKDQFDDYRESTIGAAFLTQTVALDEKTTVKLEIWDTAGQEEFDRLRSTIFREESARLRAVEQALVRRS